MNRRILGMLGVGAALVFTVAGCKGDPLSDADGSPAAIVADFTYLQLTQGDVISVNASVVDGRSTPLEIPVTFSACDADVTVAADPTYTPVPLTRFRATVNAVAAGVSCIQLAGGGLTGQIDAAILPTSFNGAASSTTPVVGQTLRLLSSALLRFANTADIDFGGGVHGEIITRTADTLLVRVPQTDAPAAGPFTVSGIDVTYLPGLVVSLPSSTIFSAIGSAFGGAAKTAPDAAAATITIPGDGAADLVFYDGFKSADVDYFYPFTIAATDTITFTIEWDTAADIDLINCNVACAAFVGGFGAATGANPETYSVIFPAGSYNLLIEAFDNHGEPAHLFKVTISNP